MEAAGNMKVDRTIAGILGANQEVNLVVNQEVENYLRLDQKTHVTSIEKGSVIEVLISDLQ